MERGEGQGERREGQGERGEGQGERGEGQGERGRHTERGEGQGERREGQGERGEGQGERGRGRERGGGAGREGGGAGREGGGAETALHSALQEHPRHRAVRRHCLHGTRNTRPSSPRMQSAPPWGVRSQRRCKPSARTASCWLYSSVEGETS